MEAKLIKDKHINDFYYLMVGINTYATTHKESFRILSLKNCQAIELGYDLDELAKEELLKAEKHHKLLSPITYRDGVIKGFQKALSILGDKKFSEDDLDNFRKFQIQEQNFSKSCLDVWLKSLQQTEWDCVIFVDEKTKLPLLDNEGNLILKRR